jgi:hypothetical protein
VEALPEPSDREQTKEAKLKEVHARMTENLKKIRAKPAVWKHWWATVSALPYTPLVRTDTADMLKRRLKQAGTAGALFAVLIPGERHFDPHPRRQPGLDNHIFIANEAAQGNLQPGK